MGTTRTRRSAVGAVAVVVASSLAFGEPAAAAGLTWAPVRTPASPSARASGAIAYDAAAGEAVLFGGTPGDGTLLRDTWTLADGVWTGESPSRSPVARTGHAMAYDPVRQEVVLFGGRNHRVGFLADTWTWDGSTWNRERPATSPSPRFGARMAHDPATGTLLLFGGSFQETLLDETWAWDGSTWKQLQPTRSPPPRSLQGMATDEARGQVVLFGGLAGGPGDVHGDTWVWNGSNWVRRRPDVAPMERNAPGMAWDAGLGMVVLFGGSDDEVTWHDDTWQWDGTNWKELAPARSPVGRAHMMMTSVHGRPLVFGGANGFFDYRGDTWVLRSG